MEIYQNKLSIIKDFIYIFNSQDSYYLFDIIESKKLNNDLLLKEFIVEELVFFYIILLIGLIKKEKNSFHSGLHNLSFYFHQSFIIFIYIIVTNIHFNNNIYKDNEMMSNYQKCMQILDENKTWLDKKNYKTYLQNNNSISKQILMNILNQIKQNFQSNSNIISKKNVKKKKNSNFMNDNNEIIEDCKNIFMSYLKSYKSIKITDIIKEIKNYSPINELYEVVKMDKIISQFSESKNGNNETVFEDFNVENNIYNNEMPKEPFLKPINPKYKYTLVLDLDETLVHYISDNESAYIQIRPGAENFLKELSEFYEIVIFTAALQTYADLVIDGIDPDGVISDRLYRQHTINVGNINIKDLDKLGRDIKHIIIIDNFMENYSLQPKNGLNIIDFEGNEYDDELEYLKEDLLKLVKLNPNDVRPYLTDIQRGMDKRAIYFQKVINDKKYKEEELMIDKNKNNNLFDEILNDNNFNYNCDERINTESKNRKNEKGYSFTEESDNV
jgi:CTD small phosphatase-like protein 2